MISNSRVADSSKVLPADVISVSVRSFSSVIRRGWTWITLHSREVLTRSVSRRLKVAEMLSLGEKRFVSIIQVDDEQFLLGGSSSHIVLLAKLETKAGTLGGGTFTSFLSDAEASVVACHAVQSGLGGGAR